MNRRQMMAALGGAATWPFAARAQQRDQMRRIGVQMSVAEDAEGQARYFAFRQTLAELGWVEGRNLSTIARWGYGDQAYIAGHAAELVVAKPDVIFAAPANSLPPLQQQTTTIPIVFAQTPDPVALGLVKSVAHPGGNITGFALFEPGIAAKWIELLRKVAPSIERAAVINDPNSPTSYVYFKAIQAAASELGVEVMPFNAVNAADVDTAFEAFARLPKVGLVMPPSGLAVTQRELIVALAAKFRVPGVYAFRYYAEAGGLAS
jgi:putative ABC transport system substrate-binding protein